MTAPEDNLPAVEPPSARFLMQLFVVPMVIVVVIVMVCLMFNWLAHLGAQPRELVGDLAKLNAGSWQKALTIANMLTDRRHAELRQDPEMAGHLAQILDDQLEAADMSAERIKLRIYLCTALGVFEVDEGLSSLIEAASMQRELPEIEVQKAAIEALAHRVDQSAERRAALQQNSLLLETLDHAASQRFDQLDKEQSFTELRLRAAYTLGVLGGADALETLAGLLSDGQAAVRYNAATGLARHGDQRAVPRLIEMLQIGTPPSIEDEPMDDIAATRVIRNALRATVQLADANPALDLTSLRDVIARLDADPQVNSTVRRGIEMDAKAALHRLDQDSA